MANKNTLALISFIIFVFISYIYTDLLFIDPENEYSFHNFFQQNEVDSSEHLIYLLFDEPIEPCYYYMYFMYNCVIQDRLLDWNLTISTKETINYILPNSFTVSFSNKYSEYLDLYHKKL